MSTSFIVLFPYKYIKYIDHIPPSYPPHLLPPLTPVPTSNRSSRTYFSFQCFIFQVYISYSKGFHHGISPMKILYFNKINLLLLLALPLSPIPY
jgi:hypothetical protein